MRRAWRWLAAANDKGKAVTIHPAAIKNYLTDIAAMREAWTTKGQLSGRT